MSIAAVFLQGGACSYHASLMQYRNLYGGLTISHPNVTPELELTDNDGTLLINNDGIQLINN